MEDLLNTVDLNKDLPFLTFKTDKSRTTPQKNKAKFVYMVIEDEFKKLTKEEEDAKYLKDRIDASTQHLQDMQEHNIQEVGYD